MKQIYKEILLTISILVFVFMIFAALQIVEIKPSQEYEECLTYCETNKEEYRSYEWCIIQECNKIT
jgi:hypothetical protein